MNSNPLFEQALNTQRNVASFMLRFTQDLWQDENGEPKVQWRGHINHVQGDEELPFTDFTEALLFMQKQMQDLTLQAFPTSEPAAQEKLLAESFKVWEQFSANYAQMLRQAMEQGLQHTHQFQQQMGAAFAKAFDLWTPPSFRGAQAPAGGTPAADLHSLIANLTAQVESLSAQVASLQKPKSK
jgi:hypothetical protein